MNKEALLKFLSDNQETALTDLYDRSYDKLKSLNDRVNRITVYLIIVGFIFFILAKARITTFQIGPVAINDVAIGGQLLPVLFSYFLFELVITSNHKTEVYTLVKFIFLTKYVQTVEPKDLKPNNNSPFTRLALPFSFTTELSRLTHGKSNLLLGCVGFLLALPVLTLYLLPFVILFLMLKDVYTFHYVGFLGKVSFYLTIWIVLVTIFYFVKVSVANFHDLKEEQSSNIDWHKLKQVK